MPHQLLFSSQATHDLNHMSKMNSRKIITWLKNNIESTENQRLFPADLPIPCLHHIKLGNYQITAEVTATTVTIKAIAVHRTAPKKQIGL